MDKKKEKLDKLLELNQLINKTVFFEGDLCKILKINTIYIYCYNYELDNELPYVIFFYRQMIKQQYINIIPIIFYMALQK